MIKDVAVVGAGLSGLSACRVLTEHSSVNLRIDLFDARDRLGGRVRSKTVTDGLVAEEGAEFIDLSNKRIRTLAKRFDLPLDRVYSRKKRSLPLLLKINDKTYQTKDIAELGKPILQILKQDRDTVRCFPQGARAKELANITIKTYLERASADPLLMKAFRAIWADECGTEIDTSPALSLLDVSSFKDPTGNLLEGAGYAKFRMKGGMSIFAQALRFAAKACLQLEQPLARVTQQAQSVKLDFIEGAMRRTGNYDAVILALPVATLADIDISKASFSASLRKFAHQIITANHEKTFIYSNKTPAHDGGLLFDYELGGSTWISKQAEEMSHDACLITFYQNSNGPNDKKLLRRIRSNYIDLKSSDLNICGRTEWKADPFSKGSYSAFGATPELRKELEEIRRRAPQNKYGTVFLAGEWASPDRAFQCHMEGAVLSGEKAARRLLQKNRIYRNRAVKKR